MPERNTSSAILGSDISPFSALSRYHMWLCKRADIIGEGKKALAGKKKK